MVVAQARAANIPFEVCLTSNIQSGVVTSLSGHPLPQMLASGLNVTLNTDDPSISQITLGHEHGLACEELGCDLPQLKQCLLRGVQAAFLPQPERVALSQKLEVEFNRTASALEGAI